MLRAISRLSNVPYKRILFPETDSRVLLGAKLAVRQGFARPIFVTGDSSSIEHVFEPGEYEIINTAGDINTRIDVAHKLLSSGEADGMVSGCTATTANVIRSAIKYVGLHHEKTLSSFFMMECQNRVFFFSDCAVVINPTSAELCDIAVTTAQSFRNIVGGEPRVAMLSFSTKGSAEDSSINTIRNAVKMARRASGGNIHIDGELQLDAAIDMSISAKKTTMCRLDRPADVLIFPNLASGNIGYKLLQHLGGWRATGPILQGLKKPSNDLSRGCSADDVFYVTALTCMQC